ncbi:MAG: alpha/beta fold hydrolase [Acidobacteria bacterium]|nr:alpha/beta fold hydrolase [Acidobacteriota bacterium]
MIPFDPLFHNPHWQTIAGAYWPRPRQLYSFPVEAIYFQTEPRVRVLVHAQKPHGEPKGSLLLVHGLEGSSDAGYLRSAAAAALQAGYAAYRFNIRSCGGTEADCDTLYHAGLTHDLRIVASRLRDTVPGPVYAVGYSLGANIVLKLAGELGREGASTVLDGVAAISCPVDLDACARALNEPRCRLYQDRFLRNMAARLRRRHQFRPDVFSIDALGGIGSVYDFDDRITAPFFGFGNAQGYYGTQSAGLFLSSIRMPALVMHAKDDPMIPFRVYGHVAFRENPFIRLAAVDHGGHVGFLSRGRHRFWVDSMLLAWLRQLSGEQPEG